MKFYHGEVATMWYFKIQMKVASNGNENCNELVWDWFVATRAKNVPISGLALLPISLKIAQKLGNCNFKAYDGWLESFKRKHEIASRTISGEGKQCQCYSRWLENRIPEIVVGDSQEDIYNCNETALFLRPFQQKHWLKNVKHELNWKCYQVLIQLMTSDFFCSRYNLWKTTWHEIWNRWIPTLRSCGLPSVCLGGGG